MNNYTDEGGVELNSKDGVGTIEFQHPASNSLPGKVLKKLADTIVQAGMDETIKVIVLKSAGDRAFCAGASFDELISIKDVASGKSFFMGFANVINAMRKSPKFIIGRVQGKAVGGGVGLACSVDYCLATKYASVKLSELAIGIGPFVVGPAVERKVGKSAMTSMTIDATSWQTANWAAAKGIYADTFETVEELDKAVDNLTSSLAKSNPEAMRELKKTFWAEADNWDELLAERAAFSGKLVISNFTRNAIGAFKAK